MHSSRQCVSFHFEIVLGKKQHLVCETHGTMDKQWKIFQQATFYLLPVKLNL